MKRRYLAVIAIASAVAVAAPFVASQKPDGLEKTAEEVGAQGGWSIDAPIPGYAAGGPVPPPAGAVLLGTLGVFGLTYLGGKIFVPRRER